MSKPSTDPGPPDAALLRFPQAAARLGIGTTKVYELVARHELADVRIDRARRVTAASVAAYIARQIERA